MSLVYLMAGMFCCSAVAVTKEAIEQKHQREMRRRKYARRPNDWLDN